jgi:hypothetical protein
MGPCGVDQRTLDEFLDDAVSWSGGVSSLNCVDMAQWIGGLIKRGGNPNRRVPSSQFDPALCLLARSLRGGLRVGDAVLANNPQINKETLHDIVYVINYRHHPLRENKQDIEKWFLKVLDRSGETLDLQAIVPSTEYVKRSLEDVLVGGYPQLLEQLRARQAGQQLEQHTRPGSLASEPRGSGRRL